MALIRVRTAQALDDLTEMCIRLRQKMHHKAKEALEESRSQHQEQTEALVALLSQMVGGWQTSETTEEPLTTIGTLMGEDAETILAQCEAHLAYAGNNSLPCLLPLLRNHRMLFLDVFAFLHPPSTRTDTALEQARAFVIR